MGPSRGPLRAPIRGAADQRPWRRLRRTLGGCLFALLPFVLIGALVVGLGYVRLVHGPISLNVLVEPIERGVSAELGGLVVRIDDVAVSLAEAGGFEFQLRNVRISEEDGDLVASAPLAAVELSGLGLWALRIVPSRVELIDPQLSVSYSEDGRFALSFSGPGASPASSAGDSRLVKEPTLARRSARQEQELGAPSVLDRVDFARVLAEAGQRARQRLDASAYLREVGLRNATVSFEHAGHKSAWTVPHASLGLAHKSARSVISGRITVASPSGPWGLTFHTEDSDSTNSLSLKMSVRDLVPSTLAQSLPQLSLLQMLDMPVAADATLEVSKSGEVLSASLGLEVGHGNFKVPSVGEASFGVDSGLFAFRYDGANDRLTLAPSTLRWGGSRIALKGGMAREVGVDGLPSWDFDLTATDGVLAAEDFNVVPLPIDTWSAEGRIVPDRGLLQLTGFAVKAREGAIEASGEISTAQNRPSMRLEGKISPMSSDTLKVLWPRAVAPGARAWVGQQIVRGELRGGTFRLLSGAYVGGERPAGAVRERLSVAIEAGDLQAVVQKGVPPLEVPRALVRIENDNLEITIPEAAFLAGEGKRVPLGPGSLTAPAISSPAPNGELTFRMQSPLGPVLSLLKQSSPDVAKTLAAVPDTVEGKVDGQFKVTLPLVSGLDPGAIDFEGKARLTDGRAKQLVGGYDVQGASILFDINETAIDASGEMLLNGVLAKLNWQRIFDAPPDKQPPLRLTATLDGSDRNQLGLDVNHLVLGEVPIELTVTWASREEPSMELRADLTNAELVLDSIAWRKPAGRTAFLQCVIASSRTHKAELNDFRIVGDDIAIEGSATISADNRLREFHFPDFSLNVVTRLDVKGTLRADNVWDVKARGPTFDGREFFRSLFSLGKIRDADIKPLKPNAGIDLDAEIDTVIGFSEVALRGVKLKLSKRSEKLTALDGRGTLDGGKPLAAVLRQNPGEPRRLLADSADAGQAFRLTGFYPNVQGGRVRLEVNVDGRGPAEKTGTLWVEDFRILGDPVVSEVFSGADEPGSTAGKSSRPKRHVVREAFDFDIMRLPFSVGYGQFVLQDAYLKGPLLGASIRGKVDYKVRSVNLGGTYVPLQGLNNALGGIPVLGQILSGPRGEGIFGITFAIQGPMANPQVIVNPLSVVAPGIFREIFQLTNPDPRVLPRDEKPATVPAERRVRASSTPAESENAARSAGAGTSGKATAGPVDGWSSETLPANKR